MLVFVCMLLVLRGGAERPACTICCLCKQRDDEKTDGPADRMSHQAVSQRSIKDFQDHQLFTPQVFI